MSGSGGPQQFDFLHTMDGVTDILERGLRRDDLSAFFRTGLVLLPREHPESWQARLKAALIRQGKWPPQQTPDVPGLLHR